MKKESGRISMVGWLAGLVVLILAAGLFLFRVNTTSVDIPQADLSTMEPRVSSLIIRHNHTVRSDPENAKAWADLAQVFHAHDLFPQALSAYSEAMRLSPADARWPYLAALAQTKSDPQAALPLFQQAIDLKPSNAAVYINYGEVLVRLGQIEEAEAAFRQALAIDANSSHALNGLAQTMLLREDLETALALLEQAEILAPHRGELHRLLAQVHQRLGNQDAARRQTMLAAAWPDSTRAPDPVAQAMESTAVSSQAIALRGVTLAKRGNFTAAEETFREALETRPNVASYHTNLGGALAGQGRQEEALVSYRRGLELEPDNVDSLNNFGFSLMQMGHLNEAEKHLKKALDLDPGFAEALGNFGLLEQQRNQPELAMDYFRQALEKNPGLLFARNALASQLALSGDTDGALDQWRTVLDINPNELAAIYNLSKALALRGEHAETISLLRKGMTLAPDSSRLVAALAWELATAPVDDLRNGQEALHLANRVYSAYPNQAQMVDVLAAALAETGDFDNAIMLMEKLVEAGAGDPRGVPLRLKSYRLRQPWRQQTSVSVNLPAKQ